MQISRDTPHYQHRRWSAQDFEALQHLAKQLRMYCAKIRAALAPIREAVSPRNLAICATLCPPPAQSTMTYDPQTPHILCALCQNMRWRPYYNVVRLGPCPTPCA